jgi:two-component system, response regulator RegA
MHPLLGIESQAPGTSNIYTKNLIYYITVKTPMKNSILLVDDNTPYRLRLERALLERGYDVESAATFNEAIERTKNKLFQVAFFDLKMPTGSGLDLLQTLKNKITRIFLLTGYGTIPVAIEAVKRGAVNVLQKPVDIDVIIQNIEGEGLSENVLKKVPTLDEVEREHIQRVLNDCGGNISRAARFLGLHRRSLQRKLQAIE